jgi:hypothetical protein
MSRSRFALLAVLVLSLGCAKAATTVDPSRSSRYRAADYYPLAVGNQWTYTTAEGPAIEKTTTITGVRDGYYIDDALGMFRVDAGGLRDDKRYMLAEPIERGRTWSSVVSVASTERYEITDVGFTTTTPAGVFRDCVAVRGTNRLDANRELRIEWVYAPGVGIVRFATTMRIGEREIPQTAFVLKSYRVAPKEATASN